MVERKYFARSFIFIILMGLSIAFFGFFVLINVFLRVSDSVKQDMLQELSSKLDIAFLLINQHYESYTSGFFDQSTAQEMAKHHLENIFYGPEKLDYFFVLSKEGVLIEHPYLKDYLNKPYTQIEDPVYRKTAEKILQAVKDNKHYVEYEFYKYKSTQIEQKVSAIRVFEPWGWIVGTGYYRTTLLSKIRSIQKDISIALFVLFALVFVIYFAFLIQYKNDNRKITKLLRQAATEKDRLRKLIQSIPQPIAVFDQTGKLIDFNTAYSQIQNYDPKINCTDSPKLGEITLKNESGTKFYTVQCLSVLSHDGNLEGFIKLFTDITEQKLQIIFWHDKANQDPLTNVANRNALEELMDSFPNLGQEFSVIMTDIDGFKQINDTYGHLIGDRVLAYFAKTVKNSVRKDTIIVRYGGDEFLFILPQSGKESAKIFVDRLRKEFQEPLKIDEIQIALSFCAGIATFPDDGKKLRDLIERADRALYAAKSMGNGQTGF